MIEIKTNSPLGKIQKALKETTNLRVLVLDEKLAELIEQNVGLLSVQLEKWLKDYNSASSSEAQIIRDLSELRKELSPNVGLKDLKLTPLRKIAIRKHLVAGYTIEDFKAVHRHKLAEWWDTADFRRYCTPETLYRDSNFPKYAEQASVPEFNELEAKIQRMIRTNEKALNLGL